MNTYTLLMSFDLPPTVVSHLRLHYAPNAMEYFARPGDGFAASIQSREGLEVILAPENSVDYQKAAEYSATHKNEADSIYSLVMTSWMRNYAAVLLDLPAGETPWSLQGITAANTAVIVARCTMADMSRHPPYPDPAPGTPGGRAPHPARGDLPGAQPGAGQSAPFHPASFTRGWWPTTAGRPLWQRSFPTCRRYPASRTSRCRW